MRDLMVFGFILVFIVFGLRHTFISYLLWGWAGLISINAYVYGFMQSIPLVQVFALLTLTGLLIKKGEISNQFHLNRTTAWFIIFTLHGLLCALFAYPGLVSNWELFSNVLKTVLFCALMPVLVTSRLRLHALVVMAALAISFHGITDGLKFLASGGAHRAHGIHKFGDNNHFAMVLIMVLPVLLYLAQYSSSRLVRWGFYGALLLNVLAVIATNSRGGLIGLFAVAVWVVFRSNRKLVGIFVIGICVSMVVLLAPDSWSDRMNSIQSANDDSSFMGRVTAWKVSSAIAVANPVFGGGFRAVQSHTVWNEFKGSQGLLGFVDTPVTRSGAAAHSIWFEVMGDLGFVGFFIFLALLANAFITMREIRVLVKGAGFRWQWAADLANMLGATLFVYIITGSALSAAYFEWPYFVMMLLEVIKQLLRTELSPQPIAFLRGNNA